MQPDNELLRQYARDGSEVAFAELVKRHVNLVYSAALRQVGGDAHLAHDVAQTVFTDLARKASSLLRRESLTGWLYTSAYFAANKMARTEIRRREREEQFMRDPASDSASEADWEKLRPTLDAAMHGLKESEREAVLLRYFENRPYAEVGAKLGLTENTTRMRVERALEKLRALLAKRAITTTAALASVISANAIQVAPPTLAATLTTASLATAGAGTTFFKIWTMTNLKWGLGTLIVAGTLIILVLQRHAQQSLQAENESLAQELEQLKTDHANFSNQISAANNSEADEQRAELLRLRAEAAQLRAAQALLAATPVPIITNDVPESEYTEISIKVRFSANPAWKFPAISAGWASTGDGTSLLSKEQFDGVLKKMADRDLDLMNEAEITTLNGREADFDMLDLISVDSTNAMAGVNVDVIPYYSTNSSQFTLTLLWQQFQRSDDPSHPVQMLETSNQVNLFPGQTTALARDLPPNISLSETPGTPHASGMLLIFITPTIAHNEENSQVSQKTLSREVVIEE